MPIGKGHKCMVLMIRHLEKSNTVTPELVPVKSHWSLDFLMLSCFKILIWSLLPYSLPTQDLLILRSNHSFFSPKSFFNEAFLDSRTLTSGGQNIGVSASASVLPMNIQDWFLLGSTGLTSLQSKGLSWVFPNTTVQKHQFFFCKSGIIPYVFWEDWIGHVWKWLTNGYVGAQ